MNDLIAGAVAASIQAGDAILEVYETDFSVEEKEDSSPLTLADKRSNDIITEHLSRWDIPILSEEGGDIPFEVRSKWSEFWLVDPLDGTKEFVKRNGEFTVNIALVRDSVPVMGVIYVPVSDTLYFGATGTGAYKIESFKSKATPDFTFYDLVEWGISIPEERNGRPFTVVASRSHMSEETEARIEGKADEYPRFGPTMEWDTGAGHALILAAGKSLTRHDTAEPLTYNKENLLNPWFIVN